MLIRYRMPFFYVLKTAMPDFLIVFVIACTVYFMEWELGLLLIDLSFSIPAFLGTAISILLSFKIGQSYDRWWEARKIWGAIVNDSRSLVMQSQAFLGTKNSNVVKRIAYRQIAWCYVLGRSLRGLEPLEGMEAYLSQEDLAHISKQSNKPLAIIQLNSLELETLKGMGLLTDYKQVQLDDTLVRLCASMGKTERIKHTVFPTKYRMFLHLSIYLFVICLTIATSGTSAMPIYFGFPLIMSIATIFFMLEGTAYNLQDPFENRPSDTPITAIARTIEINIRELLQEEEGIPKPQAVEKGFYLM
jgi:putative membrane protein